MTAVSWPISGRPTTSIAASTTHYFPVGQQEIETGHTTESVMQVTMRAAGVFSNLLIKILTNNRTGASTLRLRKAAANANSVCSITAATTGTFEDTVNTDTVTAGDKWNYQLVVGAGGTTFTHGALSQLFAATTNTYWYQANNGGFAQTDASATENQTLAALQPGLVGGPTEANTQYKVKTTCTHKHLMASISANARTATTTVRSRKNTANGAMLVSIGSTATGVIEDTVNTDSLVSGDLVSLQVITGVGTQSITIDLLGSGIESTNSTTPIINAGGSASVTSGTTTYAPLGGRMFTSTTESNNQTKIQYATTLSNLACHVSSNGLNSTGSTFRSRKGAANGAQSVSIGTSATGHFEDAVNSEALISTDLADFQLVAGTGGSPIVFDHLAMLSTATVAAATDPFPLLYVVPMVPRVLTR